MAAAVKPLPLEAAAAAAIELRDELRERTGYPWVDAQPCYTAEKYAERCINGFARDAREMEVGGRTLTVGGIVGPASKGSIIRDPDGLMAGAARASSPTARAVNCCLQCVRCMASGRPRCCAPPAEWATPTGQWAVRTELGTIVGPKHCPVRWFCVHSDCSALLNSPRLPRNRRPRKVST